MLKPVVSRLISRSRSGETVITSSVVLAVLCSCWPTEKYNSFIVFASSSYMGAAHQAVEMLERGGAVTFLSLEGRRVSALNSVAILWPSKHFFKSRWKVCL